MYMFVILGQNISSYEIEYRKSLDNPEDYWGKVAEDIVWTKRWDRVLDNSIPPFTKVFQTQEKDLLKKTSKKSWHLS